MQPPTSSIPDFYYTLFAFYEPALTVIGFIGTLCDPETVIVSPFRLRSRDTDNPPGS
jgi:hypothetical protein